MGWVRLDDGLCTHVKTFTVLDLNSIGLWTLCLAFCAHELTDGFVPEEYIVARAPRRDPAKAVAKLIAAGWMQRVEGGYHIPQYLDYNPSRETVEATRAREREKKRKQGKAGGHSRWSSPRESHGEGAGESPAPSDGPVPIPLKERTAV